MIEQNRLRMNTELPTKQDKQAKQHASCSAVHAWWWDFESHFKNLILTESELTQPLSKLRNNMYTCIRKFI